MLELTKMLRRTKDPFSPVGFNENSPVGWVAPRISSMFKPKTQPNIYASVDGAIYHGKFNSLIISAKRFGIDLRVAQWFEHYNATMILNLPVGSLDVPAGKRTYEIEYSESNVRVFMSALNNMHVALRSKVQSDFNSKTPHEAVLMMATLQRLKYPYVTTLSWRGKDLNKLVTASEMFTIEKRVATQKGVLEGPVTRLEEFGTLVGRQYESQWIYAPSERSRIFLFTINNQKEMNRAKFLVSDNAFIEKLEEVYPEDESQMSAIQKALPVKTYRMFFATPDDCLTDWIVAPQITLDELEKVHTAFLGTTIPAS